MRDWEEDALGDACVQRLEHELMLVSGMTRQGGSQWKLGGHGARSKAIYGRGRARARAAGGAVRVCVCGSTSRAMALTPAETRGLPWQTNLGSMDRVLQRW